MRKILTLILLLFVYSLSYTQTQKTDSLKNELKKAKAYSDRIYISGALATLYLDNNYDSARKYNDILIDLDHKNNYVLEEAKDYANSIYILMNLNRYSESYRSYLNGLKLIDKSRSNDFKSFWYSAKTHEEKEKTRAFVLAYLHLGMGLVFGAIDENEKQIKEDHDAEKFSKISGNLSSSSYAKLYLGSAYLKKGNLDSALFYEQESEKILLKIDRKYLANVYDIIGKIYLAKKDDKQAIQYFYKGILIAKKWDYDGGLLLNYKSITKFYLTQKSSDSALFYAKKSVQLIHQMGTNDYGEAYTNLVSGYELKHEKDSVLKYSKLAFKNIDSISQKKIRDLTDYQDITFKEQLRVQELEKEEIRNKSEIRIYQLLGGLGILLVSGIFLYYTNQKTKKTNKALDSALTNLKATQSQLIQAEKMASLGELTAGIAHEIQNPLNFVNNFSETNAELLKELKDEIRTGSQEDALNLSDTLIENEEKINHHGKRAESIVKGMLQHSRMGTGKKELTEINPLADEYLRLSYHGLRAKEKEFQVKIDCHFDPKIEKLNIVPQDIGRVLLNLFNNAFYAVWEKQKSEIKNYEPTVWVSTHELNNKVVISIKDNGNGIPQNLIDKIFQPFFTTKPTGKGTGLGLSLSYDIIKTHGGEIKVDSKPGLYAEFTIEIPILP